MLLLVILAMSAQTLDLLTVHWETELNPFALLLGPVLAVAAKLALIAYLALLPRLVRPRVAAAVLILSTVLGSMGALSNGVL